MDIKFAAIIPSRGDRPMFDAAQVERAKQMGYDFVYLIDHTPISRDQDIYQRIAVGVSKALADDATFCSIIENDDFYNIEYLGYVKDHIHLTTDLFGFSDTTYYHLKTNGYKTMWHPGRSSLFCTTFKTKSFHLFPVNPSGYVDISWWAHAVNRNLTWMLAPSKYMALGIKHGIGMAGGNGHRPAMYATRDKDGSFLKRIVGDRYEFYQSIKQLL